MEPVPDIALGCDRQDESVLELWLLNEIVARLTDPFYRVSHNLPATARQPLSLRSGLGSSSTLESSRVIRARNS